MESESSKRRRLTPPARPPVLARTISSPTPSDLSYSCGEAPMDHSPKLSFYRVLLLPPITSPGV
jgi:hypothetical protein